MPKPTPNPPESAQQNDEADPASDLGFDPSDLKNAYPHTPDSIYSIAPDIDTETLLASACETLASASVMACDFAVFVSGPQRSMLLGIHSLIMQANLAVNRALDNVDPRD